MLKKIHKDIVKQVKNVGIAKSHIKDILSKEDLNKFNGIIDYYNDFLSNPKIIERCNGISNGNPIRDKHKWYEITQKEHLGRGLNLRDGNIINFYLSETFIEMAKLFHGNQPKLRNTLTWVHPQNPLQKEFSSQEWHRDPEGYKIFKIFVNFNDINQDNGPTQYVKETQYGGKHQFITFNIDGAGHKSKPPGWPLSYAIPQENVVDISGPVGTISFINTHGLHKGGLVKQGIRCLGQGNYLGEDSHAISGEKYLKDFNCNPDLNFIDFESKEFSSLSESQKQVLL
jgi:hypothetical protein